MSTIAFFDSVQRTLDENKKLILQAGKLIDEGRIEEGNRLLNWAAATTINIEKILSEAKP